MILYRRVSRVPNKFVTIKFNSHSGSFIGKFNTSLLAITVVIIFLIIALVFYFLIKLV